MRSGELAAITSAVVLAILAGFAPPIFTSSPGGCTGDCTFNSLDAGSLRAGNITANSLDAGYVRATGKVDVGGPVSGFIDTTAFGDLRISKSTNPGLLLESQAGKAVGTIVWGSPDGGTDTQLSWALKANVGVQFNSPDAGFDKSLEFYDANVNYLVLLRDQGTLEPVIEFGNWSFYGTAPTADFNFAAGDGQKPILYLLESRLDQVGDAIQLFDATGVNKLFSVDRDGGVHAATVTGTSLGIIGGSALAAVTAGDVTVNSLDAGFIRNTGALVQIGQVTASAGSSWQGTVSSGGTNVFAPGGNAYAGFSSSAALAMAGAMSGNPTIYYLGGAGNGGVDVLIQDGGTVGLGANLRVTAAGGLLGTGSELGLLQVDTVNTDCTTVCASVDAGTCMLGQNLAALAYKLVACSSATADNCICLGHPP